MITATLSGATERAQRFALAAARIAQRFAAANTLPRLRERAGVKRRLARAKQQFSSGRADAAAAQIVEELEA